MIDDVSVQRRRTSREGEMAHVKVAFLLTHDEDGYPPESVETVWATPVEDPEGYRIDNIPFFAKGVALNDIVRAEYVAGQLQFREVLVESGHSTIRVLLWNEQDTQAVREEFQKQGCSSELTDLPGLIAVDVPPEVGYYTIHPLLEAGAAAGRWDYEEGCIGA